MAKKTNRAKGIEVMVVPPYQPPKPGPGGVLYVTDDRRVYDTPRQVLYNHSDDDGVVAHIYRYEKTVRLVEEDEA